MITNVRISAYNEIMIWGQMHSVGNMNVSFRLCKWWKQRKLRENYFQISVGYGLNRIALRKKAIDAIKKCSKDSAGEGKEDKLIWNLGLLRL